MENADYRFFTSQWNNWHFLFGGNFRQGKFNLRPGAMFSYSHTRKYLTQVNFDDAKDDNLLQGDVDRMPASQFIAERLSPMYIIYNPLPNDLLHAF